MAEKTLEEKLQTITTMLDVMTRVKAVYFPEREEKDEIVKLAHGVLKRELTELNEK